jgi:hypothetical protein
MVRGCANSTAGASIEKTAKVAADTYRIVTSFERELDNSGHD